MSIATHALSACAGFAAGMLAIALLFSGSPMWRTRRNVREGGCFECSECGSRTDYEPMVPFRHCPMCGAVVIREDEL